MSCWYVETTQLTNAITVFRGRDNWTLRAGQVEITALPGETIDSQTSTALSSEASDVLRYLGVEADAL